MLVSFTLQNFRSFKTPAMISMLPIRRLRGEEHFDGTHFIETRNGQYESLLKTAVIYGANASGKSNLLFGISRMKDFVLGNLSYSRRNSRLMYDAEAVNDPFVFSQETVNKPTLYEMHLLLEGSIFRYGFEVKNRIVEEEWLYKDEEELFHRTKKDILAADNFEEGKGKEKQTREDALFLSVCASYNGTISSSIVSQFENIRIGTNLFGARGGSSRVAIRNCLTDNDIKERLIKVIKLADPGIQSFERTPNEDLLSDDTDVRAINYLKRGLPTFKAIYDGDGAGKSLNINELSAGTLKMLLTAGDILRAIDKNEIVVIDEIDIQLHPLLIEILLQEFHLKSSSQAQLLFTTHNTYPLRKKLLRRDQVWFVNKQPDLSSQLVNFSEFKVRPDASYEKDYLNGRYGGIPLFEMSDFLSEDYL